MQLTTQSHSSCPLFHIWCRDGYKFEPVLQMSTKTLRLSGGSGEKNGRAYKPNCREKNGRISPAIASRSIEGQLYKWPQNPIQGELVSPQNSGPRKGQSFQGVSVSPSKSVPRKGDSIQGPSGGPSRQEPADSGPSMGQSIQKPKSLLGPSKYPKSQESAGSTSQGQPKCPSMQGSVYDPSANIGIPSMSWRICPTEDNLHIALLEWPPAKYELQNIQETLHLVKEIFWYLETNCFDSNNRLLSNVIMKKFPQQLIKTVPQQLNTKQFLKHVEDQHQLHVDNNRYPTKNGKKESRPKEESSQKKTSSNKQADFQKSTRTNNRQKELQQNKPLKPCVFCSGDHYNNSCSIYKTVTSRTRRLVALKLCLRCFNNNHQINTCACNERTCNNCGQKGHHRVLCPQPKQQKSKSHKPSQQERHLKRTLQKMLQYLNSQFKALNNKNPKHISQQQGVI